LFVCGGRWETGACDVVGVVDEGYLRKCLRLYGRRVGGGGVRVRGWEAMREEERDEEEWREGMWG
jgi:hypothetical protein